MTAERAHLVYAMTASGTTGGIATANHNVLRALAEVAEENRRRLVVISYLEGTGDRPPFLPVTARFVAADGSRVGFAAALIRFAMRAALVGFDHVTLALPILPLSATGLVRTFIFAHGSESWKRLRPTSRWSFRAADLCLTNSAYTLRNMQGTIGPFEGRSCPLGLSPRHELRHGPAPPSGPIELVSVAGQPRRLGRRVLLLVARLDPKEREKGHRELIAVLPDVLRRHPDTQLVFPGPGADRAALEEAARRTGVADSVFLPGRVPAELLDRLYAHCYAFVMPSRQEGFGLVYLEAMNHGKPCVGCFDDGAEEVIVDRETGLLVRDPSDPNELRSVLFALLHDPEFAARLGRAGLRRLHERFTARHHQDRVKHHVSRLLVGASQPGGALVDRDGDALRLNRTAGS